MWSPTFTFKLGQILTVKLGGGITLTTPKGGKLTWGTCIGPGNGLCGGLNDIP
jgi:hypothetical protein